MATVSQNVTNSQAVTITLASLANAANALSNAIDNSTNKFVDAILKVQVKTNAAGTSSIGIVNVYLVRSTDGGTSYSDNAGILLGTIAANVNATTYVRDFNTGPLGSHWKVTVENKTGAALDSTAGSHKAEFAGIKYDVA